jgi:DNA end-binding protein Ku
VAHESTYVVQPSGKGAEQAYAVLAEALRRSGKMAVVSVAVRKRAALALLYPGENGYLVLERLQWAASVGTPPFEAPAGAPEDMIEAAQNLIGLSAKPFDWTAQEDTSAKALAGVIQAKIETGQVTGTPVAPGTGASPAGLMAALAASVEAAKPKPAARKPRARKTIKEAA